jgi:type IV pilus assembly protein PilB
LLDAGVNQEQIASAQLYKAVGCSHCTDGHLGRIGLYEVLPISEAIGRIIMEGGNARDLAQQAISEGITTLREAALNKALKGIISLDEVNRISYE